MAVQIQRIGEAHIERRAQPQLLADPHRQHAAMHEHRAPAEAGRRPNHRFRARVLTVRSGACREQANRVQAAAQRDLHPLHRAFFQRVHHEEPEKPVGALPPRLSPRTTSSPGTLAISAARATPWPSSSAAHVRASSAGSSAGSTQLRHLGHLLGRLARLRTQRGEEVSGKKVDVRVGDSEVTPGSLHRVCSSA